MNNRQLKRTARMVQDDPNYEFKSEWHKQRHIQAYHDRDKVDSESEMLFVVLFVVVVTLGSLLGMLIH